MRICVANTPLILTNETGKEYRVELGETVTLSDEQYESVAAHVSVVSETEDLSESEQHDAPVETEKTKSRKKAD